MMWCIIGISVFFAIGFWIDKIQEDEPWFLNPFW